MVPVFHNRFNKGSLILLEIGPQHILVFWSLSHIGKESIQTTNCLMVVWNNVVAACQRDFVVDSIFSDKNASTVFQKVLLSDIFWGKVAPLNFLRKNLIRKRQMISPRVFLFTRCMLVRCLLTYIKERLFVATTLNICVIQFW